MMGQGSALKEQVRSARLVNSEYVLSRFKCLHPALSLSRSLFITFLLFGSKILVLRHVKDITVVEQADPRRRNLDERM